MTLKPFAAFFILTLAFSSSISGQTPASYWRVSWGHPLPNYAYYKGKILLSGREITFMTRDNTILLPSSDVVNLGIYTTKHKKLRDVTNLNISKLSPQNSIIEGQEIVAGSKEPEVQTQAAPIEVDPDVEEDYPQDQLGDYGAKEALEDGDLIIARSSSEEGEGTHSHQVTNESSKNVIIVSAATGMGKQALSARGGVSNLEGNSLVQSFYARGLFQTSLFNYPNIILINADSNKFKLENKSPQDESESNFNDDVDILDYTLFLSWMFSMYGSDAKPDGTGLWLGIGSGMKTIPEMVIADNESGYGKIKQNIISPISLRLLYNYNIGEFSTGVDLSYVPLAGNANRIQQIRVEPNLTWLMNKNFSLLTQLVYETSKTENSLGCPEVSNCKSTSTTDVSKSLVLVGGQIKF